jgi:alpha-beta hydrolase superfamily lysophospholipase
MAATTSRAGAPDTIVLVHGLWMTPRSWEHWVDHYENKGYTVLTPAYPGLDVEVEALRADPVPIAALSIPDTVASLETLIQGLATPPILMGHSFGGALVQILLDHGYGAAGVAIDSVPTEGVLAVPLSQIKASFPVLENPANRHRAVAFTPKQFHYAFTNTLSEEDSQAAYDRYAIAAPGSWVWGGVLANFTPGHQDTWVDYTNANRPPLLFIAGGKDNIMPLSVNESNKKKYRAPGTVTDIEVFPERSHFTVGAPGWEAVADYALDWAIAQTAASR